MCNTIANQLSQRRVGITAIKAFAEKAASPSVKAQIVDLAHSPDPIAARNAAWVMTHFSPEVTASLQPRLHELITLAIASPHVAVRRLLLATIERLRMEGDDIRTDFLDFCLEHMADPNETPGVQSLCMKLAHRQCRRYPELLHEFATMLMAMDTGYAKSTTCLKRKFLKALASDAAKR